MKQQLMTPLADDDTLEDSSISKKDDDLFMKHSAIKTLLLMAIGPVLNTLGSASTEIIDLALINKRFSDMTENSPAQVYGFLSSVFLFMNFFASYFGQAVSIYVPSLIGAGKKDVVPQVFADVLRFGILGMIIVPFALYFSTKPIAKFMGCPDDLLDDCLRTFFPILFGGIFLVISNVTGGIMQGYGKSFTSGLFTVITSITQSGLLTPIFLFVIKIGPRLVKLPQVIAALVTGIAYLILLFKGSLGVKMEWRALFRKPVKETGNAMLLALPMLFGMIIMMILPPTLLLVFMTKLVDASEDKKALSAAVAVFTRIQTFALAIPNSLTSSFLSTGSHAKGAKQYRRFLIYFFTTLGFALGVSFIMSPIMIANPRLIAKGFLSNDLEIFYAERILKIPFYTQILNTIDNTIGVMMVTLQNKVLSALFPIMNLLFLIVGPFILSINAKGHPERVMYLYTIADLVDFVVFGGAAIYYVIKLVKLSKQDEKYSVLL